MPLRRAEKTSVKENCLEGELALEVGGEDVPFMRTVGCTRLSREGSSCEVEEAARLEEILVSSGTPLFSSGGSSRSGAGERSVRGVRVPSTARSGSCLSWAGGWERWTEFCWGTGEPESGAGEREELLSSSGSWVGWAGEVVVSGVR